MTKQLFSPWRSAYIESFNEKKKKKGCLFCGIKQNPDSDDENLVVYRGEHCFIVMNKFPYNSGHVMIVPYRHTASFTKLSDAENQEIMRLTGLCIAAFEKVSKPHGFNFGANLGRVAGAGIDKHIHFHLVPRWNGDVNFMPVLGDVKVVSEDTKTIRKKLQKLLHTLTHA